MILLKIFKFLYFCFRFWDRSLRALVQHPTQHLLLDIYDLSRSWNTRTSSNAEAMATDCLDLVAAKAISVLLGAIQSGSRENLHSINIEPISLNVLSVEIYSSTLAGRWPESTDVESTS